MTYLDEYFIKYIKQYVPYQDKEFFQILIKFIQETFLLDSYNGIPKQFKTLYEDHILMTDLYDVILQSLGYDKHLLNDLTFNQKKLILTNYPNYHFDKGDLKSFKNICTIFNESISLYELYIDYRPTNLVYNWYFIPKPIWMSDNIIATNLYNPIDYVELYNDTNTYFIHQATLINNYTKKELKLPIKSNLMLMEVSNSSNVDEITNLTLITFLNYFKDLEMTLNFDGINYNCKLLYIYYIWNYFLFLFYTTSNQISGSNLLIVMDPSSESFPFTLESNQSNSLQLVLDEYETLESLTDISLFYNRIFKDSFFQLFTMQNVTAESINRDLSLNIDVQLMEYVNSISDDVGNNFVLTAIRNSIVSYMSTSNNEIFNKYSKVLLNIFEIPLLNPTNTASYKLLNYFKPFHTRLITKFRHGITYKSKFTNVALSEKIMFLTQSEESSSIVISEDCKFLEVIHGISIFQTLNTVVVSENIANEIDNNPNLQLYWPDFINRYATQYAVRVVNKFWTPNQIFDDFGELLFNGYWTLVLDTQYLGTIEPIFSYCFIRY